VGAQGELSGKGAYDCAGVFVDPSFLSPTAAQGLTEPVVGIAHEALPRAFDLLADEMTGAGEPFPLFAEGWAMQALAYVARTARPLSQIGAPEKRGLAPWQLRRATEMFRSDLTENLKLQRVAEACRLSGSHFSRAFRTSTGLPPHRWVMRKRVERAQDLLVGSFVPLAEIALTCGFADQSHFSRVFRVIRGVSPGAWRRKHRVTTPEWNSQAREAPIPARALRSA
jgi:AraC-like DNA-binding protein